MDIVYDENISSSLYLYRLAQIRDDTLIDTLIYCMTNNVNLPVGNRFVKVTANANIPVDGQPPVKDIFIISDNLYLAYFNIYHPLLNPNIGDPNIGTDPNTL